LDSVRVTFLHSDASRTWTQAGRNTLLCDSKTMYVSRARLTVLDVILGFTTRAG
jgi:hypothetical protein